jgi:iron complex transport system substrate-binding protein
MQNEQEHISAGTLLTWLSLTFLLVLSCLVNLSWAESKNSEKPPQRIVSLGPINTENVFLLGAGDRLVGTTVYCVRPEAAKLTEKVGSVMQVSVEKIIALRPDLVLATGLTSDEQVNLLKKVGIKVVRFEQPSSFASSCQQFIELGYLLGLEDKANTICNKLQKQVKNLANEITKCGLPGQKVIMQIGANPLYISGSDSFTNDFITLLHAENGIGNRPSGRIGYEQVIVANPDVILIGMMGSETGVAAEAQKKWMDIKIIKAVRDNRIYVVDPDLVCSPSPATFVQALKMIAPLIYPELSSSKINHVKYRAGEEPKPL